MSNKINVVAIVGPTATGKTKLAIEIAKKIKAEIINADSMQVYKGMNIGTAKPSKAERENIPYHLIDVVDNKQNFNLADYVKLAHNKINEVYRIGKLPMLVGGTGLYIDAVLKNFKLDVLPENKEVRDLLEKKYEQYGQEYLFNELKALDSKAAGRIAPNNVKRIIRALEINYLKGKNLDECYLETQSTNELYNSIIFGLNYKNRDVLYENINKRVDEMVAKGLVEEVKSLLKEGLSKTAGQAIGYKEFQNYFLGNESLENVVNHIKQSTRKYAKRQLTWFKKNKKIIWINIDEYRNFREILNFCLEVLEKYKLI